MNNYWVQFVQRLNHSLCSFLSVEGLSSESIVCWHPPRGKYDRVGIKETLVAAFCMVTEDVTNYIPASIWRLKSAAPQTVWRGYDRITGIKWSCSLSLFANVRMLHDPDLCFTNERFFTKSPRGGLEIIWVAAAEHIRSWQNLHSRMQIRAWCSRYLWCELFETDHAAQASEWLQKPMTFQHGDTLHHTNTG